ncbi:hypothetical protein OG244_34390 [Streptomyces brevispora]|uniref:hypothetical protein n=1 Tax=Streptomyces brevispora TaxID=887462 RepID=UPI002E35105D|nr:hypothetical protein [Streptomyces brevispora]
MKQIAHAALSRSFQTVESGCDGLYCSSGRILMTDVSLHGDIGFVLVAHRRRDGLVAEEIYYAIRNSDGTWQEPDHLSGGLVGIDPQVARDVKGALRGETMTGISDAESLIYTGRFSIDDGYESIRFLEVLTAPWIDHIEVADRGRPSASVTRKPTPHTLSILVAFPEERLLLRTGSDGSVIHFDGAGVVADDEPGTS